MASVNTPTAQAKPAAPATIEDFLDQQNQLKLLRFITCGSVDDGKSTLIGRMLWESQLLFDDQLAALQSESKKYGTQGGEIDFALLVDGLAAEREQGITIDVAYRFFATAKRKFIVADTPGHEQYTRNMITGASTADVAILLVDARAGLLTQTRRHAYLTALVGIRNVVLAINKMDLVAFSAERYHTISAAFAQFAQTLGFASITTIPISALGGDNIAAASAHTDWYHGPTLVGYLETVALADRDPHPFAFPVQWVNRPDANFRGYSGSVADGRIAIGDHIQVCASGQTATVAEIITMDGSHESAHQGDAVTLKLDREIDASRGDVLTHSDAPIALADQFEATLVWMHDDAGQPGRSYAIKLASQWAQATLTAIEYRTNVNTLEQEHSTALELNDIANCRITTSKPLAHSRYQDSRALGSFILVDRFSHATVAAGMIVRRLEPSFSAKPPNHKITRQDREQRHGHRSKIIRISAADTSQIEPLVNALELALHRQGIHSLPLASDLVQADAIAELMLDAGLVVITTTALNHTIAPHEIIDLHLGLPNQDKSPPCQCEVRRLDELEQTIQPLIASLRKFG